MQDLKLLKKIYIIIYKFIFQLAYNVFSNIKRIRKDNIVISLYRTDELEGNLKFIYEELKEQLPNVKIHLVNGQNKMNFKLFKEVWILSNAKYVVLDDYYLPVYLIKFKKNIKIIQLWHAAGAMKKFGYSTVGTKFGPTQEYLDLIPIHKNYTHVYISADKFKKYYAEAFNMSEKKIYSFGIPRIDLFQNEKLIQITKVNLLKKFPNLKRDKCVNILIAPTYRAQGKHVESKLELINSIQSIILDLKKSVNIILKPHPYMNKKDIFTLAIHSNVTVATDYPINDLMLISDAFLTDYSSAIFDFSLLNRPMAHFIPDETEYTRNRGLYEAIQTISSGIQLRSEDDITQWINKRKPNEYFDSNSMINYNFDNTKDVSLKIVKHFISI